MNEIYQDIDDDSHEEFTKFIDFLVEKEYGMYVEGLSIFPELEKVWESPEIINNAIVDVKLQKHDFLKIFNQLDILGCKYLQIRLFER